MISLEKHFQFFSKFFEHQNLRVETEFFVEEIHGEVIMRIDNTAQDEKGVGYLLLQDELLNLIGELPIKFRYQVTYNENFLSVNNIMIIVSPEDYQQLDQHFKNQFI